MAKIFNLRKAFFSHHKQGAKQNILGFSEEVNYCFLNYSWPCNIRELKNVIRKISLLTEENIILLKASPQQRVVTKEVKSKSNSNSKAKTANKKASLRHARLDAELTRILAVLKQVKFNKTKAAKILNIDRKTLYNKIIGINLDELN